MVAELGVENVCLVQIAVACHCASFWIYRKSKENVGRFCFKLNRWLVERCICELLERRKCKKVFGK